MGRYIGPVCRLCRREGVKLFLKGPRCASEKCALDRRNSTPGARGQSRPPRASEYLTQLREKQKLKRIYGLFEAPFKQYFYKAEKKKGVVGDNLLVLLASRLDNVVYQIGFALSRKQARMLIGQNHFRVNGKPTNIPSYLVNIEDVIDVREKSRSLLPIKEAMERMDTRRLPDWLEIDKALFRGLVKGRPTREALALPVNERRVVELYSR